ncbi:MAG: hypothetical protein IVW57_04515 [Ktedonobacterales bacterium]|nr:hypothetical protein [Ktedonobacterales bacterium]
MVSLVLSLLFGIGQVVAGVLLTRHGLLAGRWRRASIFLAMLFGVWFATSGLAELLVSGMEASRQLFGTPGHATFALWRGRADRMLVLVTGGALIAALLYPALVRVRWARRRAPPSRHLR